MLAGDGALMMNLDLLLRSETKLPIKIAADPLAAVAVRAGEALSNLTLLRNLEKQVNKTRRSFGQHSRGRPGRIW